MSRPKGFTLIELLVVVSIIALLVAILVPALSEATEAAKSVVCLSNMRQIHLAFTFYREDNNDTFPSWNLTGPPPSSYMLLWYEATNAYLETPSVYQCPSGEPGPEFDYNQLHYGYNFALGDYSTFRVNGQKVQYNDIRVPSRIILLVDSNGDKRYDCLANAVGWLPGNRHRGGGNMIHADGSTGRYDDPEDISDSSGVPYLLVEERIQLMWGHYGSIYE